MLESETIVPAQSTYLSGEILLLTENALIAIQLRSQLREENRNAVLIGLCTEPTVRVSVGHSVKRQFRATDRLKTLSAMISLAIFSKLAISMLQAASNLAVAIKSEVGGIRVLSFPNFCTRYRAIARLSAGSVSTMTYTNNSGRHTKESEISIL